MREQRREKQRMRKRDIQLIKYSVFISHSRKHEDNEIALMIYQQLKQDYIVYLDLSIDENGRFDEKLEKHVKKCQDFILIVPRESIGPDSWVGKEVEWAMKNGKNIIPIVLGTDNKLEERFPDTLRDVAKINWIEYHAKQTDQIIKLIKKRMVTVPGYRIMSVCSILVLFMLFLCPIFFDGAKSVNSLMDFSTFRHQHIGIEIFFLICLINSFFMDSWICLVFFIKKIMHMNYKKQLVSYIEYENWKKVQGCRGLKKEDIIEWCIRALSLPLIVLGDYGIVALLYAINSEWNPWIIISCIELISFKALYRCADGCLKYEEYCWKKNREIIVFSGTVDKSKLMGSEKFINWVHQMCEENVLFTVKEDFELRETLYEIIEGYVEKLPDLEVKDFWIEDKNIFRESKNNCFIYFSYQKEKNYPPNSLIFVDSEGMPEDKSWSYNIKSMNELNEIGKYVSIMKLKFYSEKTN